VNTLIDVLKDIANELRLIRIEMVAEGEYLRADVPEELLSPLPPAPEARTIPGVADRLEAMFKAHE